MSNSGLLPGMMVWYNDFVTTYRGQYTQITLAAHPAQVESMAQGLGLPTVPYAFLVGRGEYWACWEEPVCHPQVGYEFIGYQGVLQ